MRWPDIISVVVVARFLGDYLWMCIWLANDIDILSSFSTIQSSSDLFRHYNHQNVSDFVTHKCIIKIQFSCSEKENNTYNIYSIPPYQQSITFPKNSLAFPRLYHPGKSPPNRQRKPIYDSAGAPANLILSYNTRGAPRATVSLSPLAMCLSHYRHARAARRLESQSVERACLSARLSRRLEARRV